MTCLILCIRSVHSVLVLGCFVDRPATLFGLRDASFSRYRQYSIPVQFAVTDVRMCQRGRVIRGEPCLIDTDSSP